MTSVSMQDVNAERARLRGALEHCENVIKEHLRDPGQDLDGFMRGAHDAAMKALNPIIHVTAEANRMRAAIDHALERADGLGLEWLRDWTHGDAAAMAELRTCRVCGCGDHNACVDEAGRACYWAEPDLCSACSKGRLE